MGTQRATPPDQKAGRSAVFLLTAIFLLHPSAASAQEGPEPPGPPGAPVGLVALPASANAHLGTDPEVLLRWQPPREDGGAPITEYRVYRARVTDVGAPVGASAEAAFRDTIAEPWGAWGNPYLYQITAVNSAGEGESSAPVFFSAGGPCAEIDTSRMPPAVAIDPECAVPHPGGASKRAAAALSEYRVCNAFGGCI